MATESALPFSYRKMVQEQEGLQQKKGKTRSQWRRIMELGNFVDLLFRHNVGITSYHYRSSGPKKGLTPWWFIQDTRELANEIDFNKVCQFDRLGRCNGYKIGRPRKTQMCCCHNCSGSLGYLEQVPKNIEVLRLLAKSFDEKTGFWRKGGCALPRKYRSKTCLVYTCFSCIEGRSLLTDRENLILNIIEEPSKYYIYHYSRHVGTDMSNFVEYELKKIRRGKQNDRKKTRVLAGGKT